MLRIAYMSRARRPLTSAIFDELAATSKARNWHDGITGLLLFDGYRFLQAIEGRSEAVARCYDRIIVDPRHYSVVEQHRQEGTDRQFGDWSLQALDLSDQTRSFQQSVVASTSGVADPNLRAMFIGFASLAK